MKPFKNRRDAGRKLAAKLGPLVDEPELLILALPRGGVPVAYEIAQMLHQPLDVCVVRKLGVPGQEEFAMGALSNAGDLVLNEEAVAILKLPPAVIEKVADRERQELRRRETLYRQNRPPLMLKGKAILLVDDGLATGSSMEAALLALRRQQPRRLIVAVPVASRSACRRLQRQADKIICLSTPEPFYEVGASYLDFSQTSDQEVITLLAAMQNGQKDETSLPDLFA